MSDPGNGDLISLTPIGVVHSPYDTPDQAPHQGFADDAEAVIEVYGSYQDALTDIEDVLRLTVIYWAHLANRSRRADDVVGPFARRGPTRPNPLCICACTVLDVDGRRIRVRGLDAIDGSPVVDLKPALQAER